MVAFLLIVFEGDVCRFVVVPGLNTGKKFNCHGLFLNPELVSKLNPGNLFLVIHFKFLIDSYLLI